MRSTTVTTRCDRCGAQVVSKDKDVPNLELRDVGVTVGRGYSSEHGNWQEWCEACCIATGLVRAPKPKDPQQAPVEQPAFPTIEDMLRELAREEAANVMG